MRPDPIHTSLVTGLAWMDPKPGPLRSLLRLRRAGRQGLDAHRPDPRRGPPGAGRRVQLRLQAGRQPRRLHGRGPGGARTPARARAGRADRPHRRHCDRGHVGARRRGRTRHPGGPPEPAAADRRRQGGVRPRRQLARQLGLDRQERHPRVALRGRRRRQGPPHLRRRQRAVGALARRRPARRRLRAGRWSSTSTASGCRS